MEKEDLLEIPENWVWSSLKILAKDIYRYPTFYGMEHLLQGVPVIRGEHINDDGTISHNWSNYWFITRELSQQFPRTILETNDLVMSVRGTIGKIGLVDKELENAQISPNCIKISLYNDCLSSRFFLFYLKSFSGQISINSVTSSTTINTIKASSLSETLIPLPPLKEQRRIVAKIEALRARSQQVKEAIAAIPPLLDQFRQSVLTAAFCGDLTADWREENPEVEPALELSMQIQEERYRKYNQECKGLKLEGKNPPKLPNFEKVFFNIDSPDNWITISVESACLFIIDCLHSTPRFVDEGEYCIDTTCIEPFKINWDKARKVSHDDFIVRTSRMLPQKDDILFSREGTIGTTVRVPESPKMCLGQRMMMFRFSPLILPAYAELYLQSSLFKNQYEPLILGTTSPHLNIGDIRKLAFPVPSFLEQQEVVHRVIAFLKIADRIEQEFKGAVNYLIQLDQSILAKAFRGELVPQDPNDEPASVLLERIQAERAKREAEAKATKKSTSKTTGRRSRKAQQQSDSTQLELPGLE